MSAEDKLKGLATATQHTAEMLGRVAQAELTAKALRKFADERDALTLEVERLRGELEATRKSYEGAEHDTYEIRTLWKATLDQNERIINLGLKQSLQAAEPEEQQKRIGMILDAKQRWIERAMSAESKLAAVTDALLDNDKGAGVYATLDRIRALLAPSHGEGGDGK